MIVLGGVVGGLLLGFGLLLLTTQGSVVTVQRSVGEASGGRRKGDTAVAEPLLPAMLVAGPVTPSVQPRPAPAFSPIEPGYRPVVQPVSPAAGSTRPTEIGQTASASTGPMSLKQALQKVESAAW